VQFATTTTPTFAHWAESDYGLSAGQHAVLPEGKNNTYISTTKIKTTMKAVKVHSEFQTQNSRTFTMPFQHQNLWSEMKQFHKDQSHKVSNTQHKECPPMLLNS